MNGDGYADVIVGASDYNNGTTRGRVFAYHGSASGLLTAAAWTAESDQANAFFAHSVASAGDVNGDGYSDVIVGAAQYSNGQSYEGRALVYHGSATGLSVAPAWSIEGNEVGAGLGYSVASAGDVNGDGFADVIVGAPAFFGVSGRAFVYHGSAAGLSSTAAWTGECDQPRSQFGVAVAPAGDVNGDGYADVILGADYYSNGQTYEGRTFVYHGSGSGLSAIAAWTAESDQANAGFGICVAAAGDVNGDGYGDVIVGADGYGDTEAAEGGAFVYHGSAAGLSGTAAWTAESNQVDAWYGGAVASAGDVNGDGYSDVVVGSSGYDNGETNEGRAFVYHGAAAGLSAVAAWTAESDQAYGYFGQSAAPAGDVNGDGYADVIVGAAAYDNGAVDEGRTFVYYGNEGAGRSLATQQLRGDGSRPAQEWGLSHHGTSFIVALNASSPWGRERAKVQAEACPSGNDFDSAGCTTFTSATWTDLGADGTARVQLPITGLTNGTLYHWRARALFAPFSVTAPGITAPPAPRHTPWRRLGAQEDNFDVRAGAEQAVTIGLVSATATVAEAGPNVGVPIVVTTSNGSPTVAATSVAYTTIDGTAIAGSDYTTTAGRLDVPAGTLSGAVLSVDVPIAPDTLDEPHEVLAFTISAPDGASLGPITTTTVTIMDDDAPPVFSVNDVTLAEGNSGTSAFTFTITKAGATSLFATVDVASADGTATLANGDYGAVALHTLSFAPEETTQTVTVDVTGDTKFESSETFFVNLTNATNATIADGQGVGTITNDDLAPALSIDDVTHAEGNSGTTNFVFTVTLAGATQQAVTVSYVTMDGTATAGSDYPFTSGTLTFEPGMTTQTITVAVVGDTVTEDDETFAVHLADETNATIDEDTATGTIQNDDALPALSIDSVTQAEGHDGPTDFVFTVTLTGATEQTVMVSWATSGNTATPGVDYTTASGMLTFAPGEMTRPITIAVTGEGVVENDETFTVTLSAPVHAVISIGAGTGTIVNDDASPFGPPELFSAASTSASTVRLSWAPVYGSTGYEIFRSTSLPAGFALLTATTATTHTDSGLVANTTYLYKVRAVSGWVMSGFCEADAATTTVFTDPTLGSAIRIKAVHVAQLRTAVNAMRTAAGLPVAVFTDPTLTPGTTLVKGAHITELRTALDGARTAIGLPSLTYTDGALLWGKTLVKSVHVRELREGTQ